MGVSADGYVASIDGRPTVLSVPSFEPATSHGLPRVHSRVRCARHGPHHVRAGLGAERWPWP